MKDNQDILIKEFKLPSYIKNKSFAEASKLINAKFKGQNDKDSQETLKELQQRLQAAQEYVKQQSEPQSPPVISSDPNSPAGSESMNSDQNISNGDEQAAGMQGAGANVMRAMNTNGGGAPNQFFLGGDADKEGPGAAGYMGAATGALELGQMAFGKPNVDTSGATAPMESQTKGAGALGGAMKGAQAGMAFGPWGAAIGGVVGGAAGLLGAGKAQEAEQEAQINYTGASRKETTNNYKKGGNLYSPRKLNDIFAVNNDAFGSQAGSALAKVATMANPGVKLNTAPSMQTQMQSNIAASSTGTTQAPTQTGSEDSGAKFNPGALLRYAPVAANALQLATLKKPKEEGYDKLSNVYNKNLVDEKSIQNIVSQDVAGMRDRIVSSSGGSGSAARANLLASQLQGTKALSDAYMQAEGVNRAEDTKAQDFKLNVDKTNLQQSNIQTQANAANLGAYESQKSQLMSQLGDDLGGVGQEELFKQYPELMGMDYNTAGEYMAKMKADKEKKIAARKLARMAK